MAAAKALPIVEAFIIATVASAPAFAMPEWGLFVIALVYAGANALLLGVPLFLVLHWRGWVNVVTATAGGFLVAMIPLATWEWPLRHSGSSTTVMVHGYGQTMVEGVPTPAGWLQYIHYVLIFSAFGAFAGFVFGFYLWARKRSAILAIVSLIIVGSGWYITAWLTCFYRSLECPWT